MLKNNSNSPVTCVVYTSLQRDLQDGAVRIDDKNLLSFMVCHQLHVDDSLTAVCWMQTDLLQEIGVNSAPFALNHDNLQELAVICVEKEKIIVITD